MQTPIINQLIFIVVELKKSYYAFSHNAKSYILIISSISYQEYIWSDVSKRGIIHRHPVQILAITNLNIILWKENIQETKIPISELSDIVVMDVHRVGSSKHYTYGYGGGYGYGRCIKSYYGSSNYTSEQIGTLVFIVNGEVRLIFHGVKDLQGIKN